MIKIVKYVNKPLEVNANQLTEGMEDGWDNFTVGLGKGIRGVRFVKMPFIYIQGKKEQFKFGDYLVVDGELVYVVDKETFEFTYEIKLEL